MLRIPAIAAGQILLYEIFDVAGEVDLSTVERLLASDSRTEVSHPRRLQLDRQRTAVTFANPPVTLALGERELKVAGGSHAVSAVAKIYDFGALTIVWG